MEHSSEPRENISQFEKLLATLAAAEIDFAVAGGIAVILNGYPRLTVDADILVDDSGDIFPRRWRIFKHRYRWDRPAN